MSPSRIIQVFHFVSRRVQCKKYIFIFIFIFLTLHLIFYFYFFSEPIKNSSSFHTSEEYTSPFYYLGVLVVGIIGVLLTVPGFFCAGDLCLAYFRNKRNNSRLIEVIEEGTLPKIGVSDKDLFSRPIIVDLLKNILEPEEDQSFYYTVCGEHGTGKTTLVRIASREVGHGVIYVDVPAIVKDFGRAFGKAINFAFEERVSFTKQLLRKLGGDPDDLMWVRALKAFKCAAQVYKDKHNRPAVIVYDNVSRLVRVDPEILCILQDDAKDNADSRTYIAVFVSSEGFVPRMMQSRSSWSRAFTPPIEIGDLSKEESIKYLLEKRKVKEEEAAIRLYELVGGRIVDLRIVAAKYLARQSFEAIKQSIFNDIEVTFSDAQISPEQKYHEAGSKIIKFLLEHKEINFKTYARFFNNNKKAAEEVLEKNVFAYHPERNVVTFQSQSVESYIRANVDDFGIKLIDLTSTDEDDATTSNQMDTIIQVSSIPNSEDQHKSSTDQHSNQEPSEISRELSKPPIIPIPDEIIDPKSEENEIK